MQKSNAEPDDGKNVFTVLCVATGLGIIAAGILCASISFLFFLFLDAEWLREVSLFGGILCVPGVLLLGGGKVVSRIVDGHWMPLWRLQKCFWP